MRECEVAEVIGLELNLKPVLGELIGHTHDTCVIDYDRSQVP